MKKIIIVDDHPIMCQGIKSILEGCMDCGTPQVYSDPYLALERIRREPPDIAVMDISMGELSGLEILKIIKAEKISTRVIILTMHHEKAFFLDAIDNDAQGFLLKDTVQQELVECIKSVLNGKRYFGKSVGGDENAISDYLSVLDKVKGRFNNLSQSEKNIVYLIAKNYNSKEIANMLFISPKTVENHRWNICRKLDISGKNALVKWVAENRKWIEFETNV